MAVVPGNPRATNADEALRMQFSDDAMFVEVSPAALTASVKPFLKATHDRRRSSRGQQDLRGARTRLAVCHGGRSRSRRLRVRDDGLDELFVAVYYGRGAAAGRGRDRSVAISRSACRPRRSVVSRRARVSA